MKPQMKLLGSVFAAVSLFVAAPASAQDKPRPNFLVIVADDLGYSDIGAFGGEIATPNLDTLAARGLKFTSLHAAATCSPTRSMLLSGLDNHQAGLGAMAESLSPNQQGRPGYEGYLRPAAASLAERFGAAGYRTVFSGKWHLGLTPEQDPHARGFQRSFAMLQGSHNHYGLGLSVDPTKIGGFTYRADGVTLTSLPQDFYSSDYFTTKLVEELHESRTAGVCAKPFLAYLAFTAPHFPLQAPPASIAKYKGRYDAGYEALRTQRLARQVALGLLDPKAVPHDLDLSKPWASLTPEQKARESRRMEVYAGMVDRLDWNVGRVIQALKDSGEYDNTVILFLSDNGAEGTALEDRSVPRVAARYDGADNRLDNIGAATSYESVGPGWAEAASAPSWRFKAFETEGGTRVVSFVAGPRIRPGVTGAYASVMDVVPTFLDLAGVGQAGKPVSGRSWAPLLAGTAQAIYPADAPIGAELFGGRSLRQGDWKLLDTGDGVWRLFDIAHDAGETQDLSAHEPGRKVALLSAYQDYARRVGVIEPSVRQPFLTQPSPRQPGVAPNR
ncbi:MAG: arylsulfatase [Novosphingobium sp.]|nr:arylsulfatase [Novosphingobium sp.]